MRYVLLIALISFYSFGCTKGGNLTAVIPSLFDLTEPLQSLTLATDEPTTKLSTVDSLGGVKSDYGYVQGSTSYRGRFRLDTSSRTIIHERVTDVTNIWSDFNFIPDGNEALLRHKIGTIHKVGVVIKAQFNSNAPTIATGCGLLFGFGNGTGHPNASKLGASLRIHDRDWSLSSNSNKTARDYFRILYETQPGAEKLTIDAPINSYNGTSDWSNFTAAQWREAASEFNVMRSTDLETAGDYITYYQGITFDWDASTVQIDIVPMSSNLDTSSWRSQSVTWDLTAAVGSLAATGSSRGGLDLTNITGSAAMSMDDFKEEPVTIGFTGNQAPRVCEFSQLQIYTYK